MQEHELCLLIPAMTGDDYQQLRKSIMDNGLLEPIVLFEGKILDGRHRWRVCDNLGLKYDTEEFTGTYEEAAEYVIAKNLARRHLTSSQKAAIATELEAVFAERAKERQRLSPGRGKSLEEKGSQKIENLFGGSVHAAEQAADAVGTNRQYVSDAKRLKATAPELFDQVRSGTISIPEAVKQQRRDNREAAKQQAIAEAAVAPLHDRVTILHGDMFDMLSSIPDGSIDLLATDPPYNMSKFDGDTFDADEFLAFTRSWLVAVLPKMADKHHIFISFASHLFADLEMVVRELGLPIQSRIIWHYRNAGGKSSGKYRLSKTYEPILHIGNRELNLPSEWDDRRFDVWTIAVPQAQFAEGKWHPTQKPVELMRRIVEFGSYEGDTILDPFAGSGTTAVAAVLAGGRDITLIEKNEEYVDVIRARIAECQGGNEMVGGVL